MLHTAAQGLYSGAQGLLYCVYGVNAASGWLAVGTLTFLLAVVC